MKKLSNKTIEIDGKPSSYIELIEMCINSAPGTGMDFKELGKRLRVKDALKRSDGLLIEFEDADFETLKICVQGMKWLILSQEIYDFCNTFS